MQTFQVRHQSGTPLFSGDYRTFRECIEDAALRGIALHGADFSHCDLSEINLDGIFIEGADFTFCNLTGANCSEAQFVSCRFENATLWAACFCESEFSNCNFSDALLGGTDISGASLQSCIFTGWDALALDWVSAASLESCILMANGHPCAFSRAPLVLRGGDNRYSRMALLDDKALTGDMVFALHHPVWQRLSAPSSSCEDFPPLIMCALSALAEWRSRHSVASMKSTKS